MASCNLACSICSLHDVKARAAVNMGIDESRQQNGTRLLQHARCGYQIPFDQLYTSCTQKNPSRDKALGRQNSPLDDLVNGHATLYSDLTFCSSHAAAPTKPESAPRRARSMGNW